MGVFMFHSNHRNRSGKCVYMLVFSPRILFFEGASSARALSQSGQTPVWAFGGGISVFYLPTYLLRSQPSKNLSTFSISRVEYEIEKADLPAVKGARSIDPLHQLPCVWLSFFHCGLGRAFKIMINLSSDNYTDHRFWGFSATPEPSRCFCTLHHSIHPGSPSLFFSWRFLANDAQFDNRTSNCKQGLRMRRSLTNKHMFGCCPVLVGRESVTHQAVMHGG